MDSAAAVVVPVSEGRVLAAKVRGRGGVFSDSPMQKRKSEQREVKKKVPICCRNLVSNKEIRKVEN